MATATATLYQMYVNAQVGPNWTDLQTACQCTEACITALSLAKANGAQVTLERTTMGGPLNASRAITTLIACNIFGSGSYDMAICKVSYTEGQFVIQETL